MPEMRREEGVECVDGPETPSGENVDASGEPEYPAAMFDELVRTTRPDQRWKIATDPTTAVNMLASLARDPAWQVQAGVAEHQAHRLPPDVLAGLLENPDKRIRMALGMCRNLSEETIGALAHDPDPTVRASLADHRHTPDLLRILSADPALKVRMAVAKNQKTPVDVLAVLAEAPESAVRWSVARNRSITNEIIVMLAHDNDPDVIEELIASMGDHSGMTQELWEHLARSNNARVRQKVAECIWVPTNITVALARDPEVQVRLALTANPKTPDAVLHALRNDHDDKIRQTTQDILRKDAAMLRELHSRQRVAFDRLALTALEVRLNQSPVTHKAVLLTASADEISSRSQDSKLEKVLFHQVAPPIKETWSRFHLTYSDAEATWHIYIRARFRLSGLCYVGGLFGMIFDSGAHDPAIGVIGIIVFAIGAASSILRFTLGTSQLNSLCSRVTERTQCRFVSK